MTSTYATLEDAHMDDEFESDLELDGETPSGFASLPPETQAEIKKLRQEAKSLRSRLSERDNEVLTAKYGEKVLGFIPEEITSYERRVELAEKFKAELASAGIKDDTAPQATPEAPAEPPSEERRQAEEAIAAVVRTPSQGNAPVSQVSPLDILAAVKAGNTSEARALAERRYRQG